MRSYTVANIKGGSGKTTISVNLAAGLALSGRKVILFDLDPQGASTHYLLPQPSNGSLADCLAVERKLGEVLSETMISGLTVAPGGRTLAAFDNGVRPTRERLVHLLSQVPSEIDFVFIDTPPTWGSLLMASLASTEGVLVPVATRELDARMLHILDEVIDQVRRHRNPQLRLAGIIPNRITRTRLSAKIEASLHETYGANVYPSIRENVRLAESGGFHAPIQITSPSSSGASDFEALTQTFLEREGGGTTNQ